MKNSRFALLAFGLLALTACEDPFAPTMRPNYTIRVVPTAQGNVAVPPECPSWATESINPFDNQPMPQFGCATARNLAEMIENPDDLVQGRPLASQRGVLAVGAIRRYDNNQPRGLITPDAEVSQPAATTAPTAASPMTGDVTGGSSAAASSPKGSE